MSCNVVDVQSVFFWLVLIAGGVGASLGALLSSLLLPPGKLKIRGRGLFKNAQYKKRTQSGGGLLVKISLLLSFSVVAVLIAIILIDVSQIEWDQFLLTFFLIATGGWMLFYIGFRWLIAPVVLIVVLYIVLISGMVQEWGCCVSDEPLMRVKVIAQKEKDNQLITSLEIHGPDFGQTEFKQITGDQLVISLSTIHFRRWVFYPRCACLFKVKDINGGAGPVQAPKTGMGLGWPARTLQKIRLIELKNMQVAQPGLQTLHTYKLISDEKSPKFKKEQ